MDLHFDWYYRKDLAATCLLRTSLADHGSRHGGHDYCMNRNLAGFARCQDNRGRYHHAFLAYGGRVEAVTRAKVVAAIPRSRRIHRSG